MKEIWKKSGLFYKIIAIMLTIVMVGTSLYFHFEKKYVAKAEESSYIVRAYKDTADSEWTIIDEGKSVGNVLNRQFAYVFCMRNDASINIDTLGYCEKGNGGYSANADRTVISVSNPSNDYLYYIIKTVNFNEETEYECCYKYVDDPDYGAAITIPKFTWTSNTISAHITSGGVETPIEEGENYVLKKGDSVTAEVKSTSALTAFSAFGDVVDLTQEPYVSITPDTQSQVYTYTYTKTFNSDDNTASVATEVSATNGAGTMTPLSCNYAYDTTIPTVALTLGGTAYVENNWYGSVTSPITKAEFTITSGGNVTYESNFNTITIGSEDKTNNSVNNITINDIDVSEGANSIAVYVKDKAGNELPTQTYTFNIDNTRPSVQSFYVGDKNASGSLVTHTDGSIILSGVAADNEQGSGVKEVNITVKNQDGSATIGSETVTPQSDGSFTADLSEIIGALADHNGTYNFEVYATDNVGNSSDVHYLNNIIIDTINPVLSIVAFEQYNTASGSWGAIDSNDISDSGVYYVNKEIYSKVRYKISMTEKNPLDLNPVNAYNSDDSLYKSFTYTGSETNYYLEIDTSTLDKDSPLSLTVKTEDKAANVGNDLALTPLQLVDSAIKVNLTTLSVGDTTVSQDNVDDISAFIENNNVKGQITIKVKALSGFDINTISLTGVLPDSSAYEKTYTKADGTIINEFDKNGIHTTNEITFVLPEEITNNIKISSLNLYVKDDNNVEKNIPIGDLLYDNTDPEITITNSDYNSNKWYQEYKLKYNLVSGESAIESDLASASYTINGTVNDVAVSETKIENASTNDIPESASVAGTTVTFAAEDKATNSLSGGVFVVKVDKTNPTVDAVTVNGSTATAATTLSGDPTIQTTVNDNLTIKDYTIDVKYNDAKYASYKKTVNAEETERAVNYSLDQLLQGEELKDGKYTVSIKATDMSGRTSDVSSTTFTVDNTAPEFTASIVGGTSGKNNSYYNTDVRVKFTCKDNNFDASRVQITDNGSPVSATWNVEGDAYVAYVTISSATGHTVAVNGNDKAGTSGTSKSVYFVIDKTAPTVQLLVNGGMVYNESMGTLNLTQAASLNVSVTDSNEDSSDLRVQVVKTVPDTATVSSDYVSTSERSFTFGDEADYIIRIYAVDKANNNSSTREISFRVDRTAPELSITGANGGTSSSATTVTFTMNEAFYSDAKATVNIYRQASDRTSESLYKTLTLNGSSRSSSLSEAITETGIYRFEFEGSDRVGHSANTSQTLTVDVNKPVITLTGVNNYDVTDGEVNISASITDEFFTKKTVTATGTRIDAEGNKNAVVFNPYQSGADPTSISQSFKEDGIYDITISSKDIAGNESVNSVHFTIDTSDPVIGDLSKYDGKTFNSIDLDIDLDELVSDLTVCDVRMYLNGSEYDGISDIEDGSYTLLITAEDELGHTSEKSVTFILDTKAPIFIVTGVEDGEIRNDKYNIEISLQLDEDILDEVTLNGKAALLNDDNTATLNINDKGEYELYMKAHDEAGNVSEQTITFTFGEESVATAVSNAVQEAASHWWMWAILIAAIFATGGIIFFVLKRRKEE